MPEDPFSWLNEDNSNGMVVVIDHIELLLCIAEGMEQAEISERLNIFPTTLQRRLRRMKGAWQVRNTPQLIAEAYHRGVLKPRAES